MSDPEQLPDATESTATTLPTTQTSSTADKKKRNKKNPTNQTLSQFSIRKPDWAYLHLQHIPSLANGHQQHGAIDNATVHLHITAALKSFLGLHGSAIPFDILRLDGRQVWIRAPAEDRAAIIAAVGGWISSSGEGWRVRSWSHWNANGLGRDSGQDLFD
ncbi:hypothetical protein CLAFUW4_03345 [Fulvia fulva]|uniref:Ribonucleases P/MRP subunit Pop8-like domain-containing protein n=1 Tax=Passalora fulva TaxID=5499 RepID=A0A9Q8LAD8_PASFU|nr:uncharacterized protein CLAFUR5_03325 [Fulvia fulva]KAK4631900.1 hypothetical protein CLAFUR4_03334 [Fulvia fulva]KAK4633255.1 hypothetical protein CLAFUR0_03339 [Fulvia fulva]UJO13735.1 hypothetical protein CLAFUR5_03325 [Fulvia fulva]WPV11301.1 hypothetical protein CLAFUW4_03345 [Fulvia fulva]WPV26253.1 hypothetical protein CLAFUW7_03337 [Fulvia fulva]